MSKNFPKPVTIISYIIKKCEKKLVDRETFFRYNKDSIPIEILHSGVKL